MYSYSSVIWCGVDWGMFTYWQCQSYNRPTIWENSILSFIQKISQSFSTTFILAGKFLNISKRKFQIPFISCRLPPNLYQCVMGVGGDLWPPQSLPGCFSYLVFLSFVPLLHITFNENLILASFMKSSLNLASLAKLLIRMRLLALHKIPIFLTITILASFIFYIVKLLKGNFSMLV